MMDYINAKCMLIWEFHHAPPELQALSTNGGDEDYIAYVPPEKFDLLTDSWFGVMRENDETGEYSIWDERNGTPFGMFCVDRHELESGALVFIGSHS